MQLKTLLYQSSEIYYRVTGNGKPVVLIHGFGEDGEIWKEQAEFLKTKYRLIIPDLPGSGRSGLIPDMSIEGMAEVIKAISEIELPGQPPQGEEGAFFGHSMGGYITLALAEKYPDTLGAFGLVHSSAFPDSEEKKQARLKSIEFIKKNGGHKFLKTSIPGLFRGQSTVNCPHSAVGSREKMDALIEKSKQFTTEALVQYYQAMYNRPCRTAVLKNFKGPILFIMGVHDIAAPFRECLQQCYLPNQSHVHILRDCAHMGMLEDPEKVNRALANFLDERGGNF